MVIFTWERQVINVEGIIKTEIGILQPTQYQLIQARTSFRCMDAKSTGWKTWGKRRSSKFERSPHQEVSHHKGESHFTMEEVSQNCHNQVDGTQCHQ